MNFPIEEFKEWFVHNRRQLPWREAPTPYQVWISEVMLQQTQVSVVIPYFHRWMEEFPTIEALARAPLEKVIKTWEGLGYYSRARYLHEAANTFVKEHAGTIPSDRKSLSKIKGLGPYTIGAILSFAFHQKAAAVDGNVMRVLSRYFGVEDPIDQPKTIKSLWEKAEAILPDSEPWLVSEGLIELGATLCKKNDPACTECPLLRSCRAYRNNLQSILPKKRKKIPITHLYRLVAIIECEGKFLVKKGEAGKVMSDLYEFPYLEIQELSPSFEQATALFAKELQLDLSFVKAFPKENHGFTRYQAHLFPILVASKNHSAPGCWKTKEELTLLPFSSGHRRILNRVL